MSALRRAAIFVAALCILMVAPSAASATTFEEASFLNQINALRASKGAAELCVNPELENMARAWAVQMANKGSISHNPNLAAQGPAGWQKLGENVGVGYDVNGLHQAFVRSPGHYANLVDKDYNQAGIGVVENNGRMFVVEVFMKNPNLPASSPKAPAAAPKKAGPPPMRPKSTDNLSPKLRSHRSSLLVAK